VWAVVAVAGLLLAVGTPIFWSASRSAGAFGSLARSEAAAVETPARSADTPPRARPKAERADPSPAPDRAPALAVRDARLSAVEAEAEASADPVAVAVPARGIEAAVDPVGVQADSAEMEIPEDVRRAGWYRYSPPPGADAGTTVLAGHVDSRTQGEGAFFPLPTVEEGDEITVRRSDGGTVSYQVVALQRVEKEVLATAELFTRDGPHRLALITCGGTFDRSAGSYRENVIVLAEPLGA
jgi:hypothetical protein